MPQTPWGATPQEWHLFSETLGLTADLLPVVSNPQAIVSPKSTMKQLGKVPSHYNRNGQVVSIPQWPQKISPLEQVNAWRAVSDLGICLQTRHVRAFDIDVEDVELSKAIHTFIEEELDEALPCRTRGTSGKRLLAVKIEGEYTKRIMTVAGGMKVEFLANGQQFIAAGTHPSGNRYAWTWPFAGIEEVPSITPETFERLWAALVKRFATEEVTQNASIARKRGADLGIDDPTVGKLDVLGTGAEGQLYILCPFDVEHTSPSNLPDTCYFPAGTGGYEKGHFKCLHAHCAHRNDGDFLDALNLRDDMFEAAIPVDGSTEAEPWPLLRRKKSGQPEATIDNVMRVLARPDLCEMEVGIDDFCGVIMKRKNPTKTWAPFEDTDYTTLRQTFDLMGFAPVGRETIRDCVAKQAEIARFDSAQAWLAGVPVWDGAKRIDRYLADYLGAEDNAYAAAVSRYLWTALAGRISEPGIKADMAIILSGPQGTGKSGMAKLLAPFDEAFTEISFSDGEDTLARRLRGKVAVEIGELKGLHNKEMEYVKAFVSRTHEEWVPKYREFAQSYPRRCIFIGTTNHEEFLADATGNRRWLPVVVGRDARHATVAEREQGTHAFEAFKRDRLQFWAEARALFKASGIAAALAEELAEKVHESHMVADSWQDAVEAWLGREDLEGTAPESRDYVKLADVLREALNMTNERITRGHEMRAANVMKGLGYVRKLQRDGDKVLRTWVKETVH